MAEKYDRENIRTLLNEVFTDKDLCRICYDVPEFRPVYDQLAKDIHKHQIVNWLLDYAERKQQIARLITLAQERNNATFDNQIILEFEKKYRQQVATRHRYIIPPHFDVARKLPINELYVSPDFIAPPRKKGEESTKLQLTKFVSTLNRTVLLGNPGGGKSTLTLSLCYNLATHHSKRFLAGKRVLPVLVVLREYGAEKKVRNCSILQFIEVTANSKYQVQPPPDAFEYLLSNGHILVIFDGLDELLDTSYRQEVSADVEAFCALYPSAPVLITSREVGYEQAPLDERLFEVFRLASFNEDQVREYVTRWFKIDTDLTPEERQQKIETFIDESQVVPDLRSNPLMLALMCNIYRGEGYIPRNRPDVYEKCALMLFERWDKSRGIHITLPFETHIRSAMMYLAYWIYADEALQNGVTEQSLIAKATEYLCPRRFEDYNEAESAAREFIEFCRGRAWVFTDTGTMKEGERLYQFTHRTFLEYFTAAHLVRTYVTPSTLGSILRPRIAKREWDVVAQLAFQLQNKNIEGAGDELLTALLQQAHKLKGDKGWNLLSFAARCLEFLVPSPKVTRDITGACIERCLTWGTLRIAREKLSPYKSKDHRRGEEVMDLLREDLLNAAAENLAIIADSLEKLLVEQINNGSESTALLATEIGLGLNFYNRNQSFWSSVANHIFNLCSERIMSLCRKYPQLCLSFSRLRKVSIVNLVDWHGIEAIFFDWHYTMFTNIVSIALATSSIRMLVSSLYYLPEWEKAFEDNLHRLREIGYILLFSPPPWITIQQLRASSDLEWSLREVRETQNESFRESLSLPPDSLFGFFVLLATMLEANQKQIKIIKKSQNFFFSNFLCWTFLARFEQVEVDKVQHEIDHCGFTVEQQAFVWRWVRQEIDLVDQIAREDKENQGITSNEQEYVSTSSNS